MENWGEYDDDNLLNEYTFEEDPKEKDLINEAIKLIFLRKYNTLNFKENELMKIFEECKYEDRCIIEKINNYLINNSNDKKIHSKKNNNYNSRFKKYSKKNNKSHNKYNKYNKKNNCYYKEREVEIEYDNEDIKEINNIEENNNNNHRSISISTTGTSKSENLDFKKFYSSDLNNNNNNILDKNNREISPFFSEKESYLPQKNTYASYLLGDNIDYFKNDNVKFNIEKFQSKLFPEVYFDKPIENQNIERIDFCAKNLDDDKYEYNWDKVIDFYKSNSSSF